MAKRMFSIGGYCENCWSHVDQANPLLCTHCGQVLTYTLPMLCGKTEAGHYIQDCVKIYQDPEVDKVRVKILGKFYKTASVLSRFSGGKTTETDARANCVKKYGRIGLEMKHAYHIESKMILTYNARTGRLFHTSFYGTGNNRYVTDVTYGSDHLRTPINHLSAGVIVQFVAACLEERKRILPQQFMQLDIAEAAFPGDALIQQAEESQRQLAAVACVGGTVKVRVSPTATATVMDTRLDPDATPLSMHSELRKLFIAMRFPNLINTGVPLTCKFFAYNRKLYHTIETVSSGKKLMNVLFPGLDKFSQSWVRTTGDYRVTNLLMQVFKPSSISTLLKCKAMATELNMDKALISAGSNVLRDDLELHHGGAELMAEAGEKRILNQFKAVLSSSTDEQGQPIHGAHVVFQNIHYLSDSENLLKTIRGSEGFEDYKLPRSNSIKELHDKLSRVIKRCRSKNRAIEYTQQEMAREVVVDGHTFTHPRQTHDIISVGETMGICVGGYADRIHDKQVTVILCHDSNGTLKLCLEYNKRTLIQAKGYCNGAPNTKLKAVVIKWCNEHNISWASCWDMKHEDVYEFVGPPAPFLHMPPVGAPAAVQVGNVVHAQLAPAPPLHDGNVAAVAAPIAVDEIGNIAAPAVPDNDLFFAVNPADNGVPF